MHRPKRRGGTKKEKIAGNNISRTLCGAVAQLGERYNGIVEVVGSIPSGSTNNFKGLAGNGWALIFE